jgi:hypothetical protein
MNQEEDNRGKVEAYNSRLQDQLHTMAQMVNGIWKGMPKLRKV